MGRRAPSAATDPDAFDLTAESAAQQAREHDPSIVFLCSPNNPTGTALPFEVIGAVLDAAPNAIVVVDEAYAEFARPGTRSALTLLAEHPRLVVTRTMSILDRQSPTKALDNRIARKGSTPRRKIRGMLPYAFGWITNTMQRVPVWTRRWGEILQPSDEYALRAV